MNITVLCGGKSPERDVSISTGTQVAKALRLAGHKVALVDSALGLHDDYERMFTSTSDDSVASISDTAPDIKKLLENPEYFGENVLNVCRCSDMVFNALHGGAGEDGTVQAAFDLLGIKYTGSGSKACAVSMDKVFTKKILAGVEGVTMPKGISIRRDEYRNNKDGIISSVLENVGLPMVVKPACGGSSVGVSIVTNESEVERALNLALGYEPKIVVEQYIKGREFSVGVLGDIALPAIEIRPKTGFYDYKNKYQQGMTEEICPAAISENAHKKMQTAALAVHRELKLSAYSRTDFIMTKNEDVYALEANTLPGMTPMSLLPQEAAAVGIDFTSLCRKIIDESMKKYDQD